MPHVILFQGLCVSLYLPCLSDRKREQHTSNLVIIPVSCCCFLVGRFYLIDSLFFSHLFYRANAKRINTKGAKGNMRDIIGGLKFFFSSFLGKALFISWCFLSWDDDGLLSLSCIQLV
ncbi:hypothetical protein BD289DRAFT_212072 [Coniella lustricola]|uniref:Uncharacterized protein n=1 Tax=Coniella lustricola TaxID=2025994 RepID=A0A2T2ZS56_9PEZI|nr:hypothetical protein BD289DRAFT_212072 [Coniella lustricola]